MHSSIFLQILSNDLLFIFLLNALHCMLGSSFVKSCLHYYLSFEFLLLRGWLTFILISVTILQIWWAFSLETIIQRLIHLLIASGARTLTDSNPKTERLILKREISILFWSEIFFYYNVVEAWSSWSTNITTSSLWSTILNFGRAAVSSFSSVDSSKSFVHKRVPSVGPHLLLIGVLIVPDPVVVLHVLEP